MTAEQRKVQNEINRELLEAEADYSDLKTKVRRIGRRIRELKKLFKETKR